MPTTTTQQKNKPAFVPKNPTASQVYTTLSNAHLETSHWGKRILAAANRGWFTNQDSADAGDWTVCACGKASPLVPRVEEFDADDGISPGCPLDDRLASLGSGFSAYVESREMYDSYSYGGFDASDANKDIVRAANTLVAIEVRAGKVIWKEVNRMTKALAAEGYTVLPPSNE